MRLPSTRLLTLSLLPTTLIACGDSPPSSSEVRSALRSDLANVLDQGTAASQATASLPTGSSFGFATTALGGSSGAAARALAPLTKLASAMTAGVSAKERRLSVTGDSSSQAIVDLLEQQVFTDANEVSEGIYKVPASLVCTTTTTDPTTGIETSAVDPDCVTQFDKAQLRIRVDSEGNGIRFFVQIDKNHDEPLSLFLSHTKLAVTVDLDDATSAMIALADAFGQTAPNAALAGAITGSIEILGAAHGKAALSFDRAISIKLADQGLSLDGPDATRFTSAKGTIVAVELDANTPHGSASLGLGATTAHIPGDSLDPAATDLALGGATVDASFQGSTLTLGHLSLGDSTTTLHKAGALAMSIDLNANDGRSLDAVLSVDPATGDETLTVTPRLDLRTFVDHAVMGDEAPVYDVTHVALDGSLRGDTLGQLHVDGNLIVETNPAQYGFAATAGQCVQATDVTDTTTYTTYTSYSVGSCQ